MSIASLDWSGYLNVEKYDRQKCKNKMSIDKTSKRWSKKNLEKFEEPNVEKARSFLMMQFSSTIMSHKVNQS